MLAIRNNCCFEGKVHYVSTQHLVGSTCDGLQRRIMESSQRGTTKSRLGAARLWGLHPLLWRHLNTPLLVFLERISSHLMAQQWHTIILRIHGRQKETYLDTFIILSLTNAVLLVRFQLVYPKFNFTRQWLETMKRRKNWEKHKPIFQGCVELLSLLNTAGNQENLHLKLAAVKIWVWILAIGF